MIRNTIFIILLSGIVMSCSPMRKAYNKKDYDTVIDLGIKELYTGKIPEKYARMIDKSYKSVTRKDLNQIARLRSEGGLQNYDKVLSIYDKLKIRQDRFLPLTPITFKNWSYKYKKIDYSGKANQFRAYAAENLYDSANELVEVGSSKQDIRKGFEYLKEIENYASIIGYEKVNQLMFQAVQEGTTNIVVDLVNNSNIKLPEDLLQQMAAFRLINDDPWKKFVEESYKTGPIHHKVEINLKTIQLSGNVGSEMQRTINKVVDGSNAYCTFIETKQLKTIEVVGEVVLTDANSGKILKADPFTEKGTFSNSYIRLIDGDPSILSEEQVIQLNQDALPYPKLSQMIEFIMSDLKRTFQALVSNTKHYVE